jgi:hypothetical protein
MYLRSMMPRTLIATILLALVSVASTSAQELRRRDDDQSLRQKFEREIFQYLVDFWTPKLAEYKQYIDRSLTPSDLNAVTNLRVRWALYMEAEKIKRQARLDEMRNYRYEIDENDVSESAIDAPVQVEVAEASSEYVVVPDDDVYPAIAVDHSDYEFAAPDSAAYIDAGDESATAEFGVGVDVGSEYTYDTTSIDIATPQEYSSEDGAEETEISDCGEGEFYEIPVQEADLIFSSVTSINDGYRPMYGILDKKVSDDFMTFFDGLLAVRDKFVTAHAAEVEADPSAKHWLNDAELNDVEQRREMIDELMRHEGKEVHAIMALYNGGSLATLLSGMTGFDGLSEEVASAPEESVALAGKSTGLMQNSPNPASTNTVISYRLAEPSSATRLRIYDPTGQVMADMNLGAVSMGNHETPLNVTSFPAGNYVYHLTVQSSMGEEVYSKVMRVVR